MGFFCRSGLPAVAQVGQTSEFGPLDRVFVLTREFASLNFFCYSVMGSLGRLSILYEAPKEFFLHFVNKRKQKNALFGGFDRKIQCKT